MIVSWPVRPRTGTSRLEASDNARRIGIERTLGSALVLLLAGILLRVTGTVWAAFAGTAMLGMAIAAGNVLLPALAKRDLPTRVGPVTSIYVTLRVGFAAVASTVSVPLADDLDLGWQGALAVWAIPVVAGLVFWLPRVVRAHAPATARQEGRPRPTRMRRSDSRGCPASRSGRASRAEPRLVPLPALRPRMRLP